MRKTAKPKETPTTTPRPIEQLRGATKLLCGRVARAYCERSWPQLRQVLLTQASKMPHRAYLDTELLDAAAPEIARLVRQLDAGLLRYETTPDAAQLARLDTPVARTAVYLVRIYRLGTLLSARAERKGALGTVIATESWETKMRQALAHDAALHSELSNLGMVLLRVLASHTDGSAPASDVLEDKAVAGTTHKLKFKIPLIPLFLDYEAEVEVGAKTDLGQVWKRLLDWLRGKPGA